MDITCPELVPIEVTSDYGSRDTSDNFCIGGFTTIYSHLGGAGMDYF